MEITREFVEKEKVLNESNLNAIKEIVKIKLL